MNILQYYAYLFVVFIYKSCIEYVSWIANFTNQRIDLKKYAINPCHVQ